MHRISLVSMGPKSGRARRVLAGALLLLAALPVFAAKGPASEKQIPIFPGAKPFVEKEDLESLAEMREETGYRSLWVEGYTTTATPEEVVGWYRKKLSPKSGPLDQELKRGVTTDVHEEVGFYDFTQFDDPDGGRARRATMERDRKPYSPGKWIHWANLGWGKRETNDDLTHFNVDITDRSYHWDGSFRRRTEIIIKRVTEKSAAALEAERDEDLESEHAGRVQQLAGKNIDPGELGVRLYPGAKHDASTTQFLRNAMASDGIAYRTGDKFGKVADFYRKQPGMSVMGDATEKEAMFGAACKEEYIPILKKTVRMGCDVRVTIQSPWMDMSTGQMMNDTLITIVNEAE